MRVAAILLALTLSAPAALVGPAPAPAVEKPDSTAANNCHRTARHNAGKGSMYRGNPVVPRKLAELPPAIGYKAVYRTVNGCEVPMTIVEYQTGRSQ
ncbi:MAG TPA: hypothetical protein VMN38_09785 [Sphingomicrobium sp.]|nr:hypothetical protein [Sphingomicrobium sp.]